jgi:hypothetical protein
LLIVGSTSWSLSLADQLRQLDVPVMIVDTSWPRLSLARQAGIATYHGEILAEATEERLELGQFQVLVATTDSEAYNALVCSEFAPEFGRDAVYQLGGSGDDEDHRSLPEALRGRAMFASGAGVADSRTRASGLDLPQDTAERPVRLCRCAGRAARSERHAVRAAQGRADRVLHPCLAPHAAGGRHDHFLWPLAPRGTRSRAWRCQEQE